MIFVTGKRFARFHPTPARLVPENPGLSRRSLFLYLNSHQQNTNNAHSTNSAGTTTGSASVVKG